MEPYIGLRGWWLTFWLTVACATNMALCGYGQGVFSGVVISDNFLTTLGLVNNPSPIGTIPALFYVGSFFDVVLTLFVGGLLGRKKTLLFGTSIMILGLQSGRAKRLP
ncbi:hypothetical protein DTO164E3_8222 [Paecilomyces variotii]|nr:hypothetical protein DTO164E3_8222 [Paecilomyces variotii]KAJ9195872.1 hypothetical protein DTO032I3_6707 [Paecilomyces variotii]KAJ9276202.1 hypothetical protein DTO021D3_6970 [Paecilomyces variotii]KAJ9340840.1 hypothetical protein DTO027B6_6647 [Paecilomyces variotii]KAJ9392174.1 hypothetical protein DTO032I4_588 [Paecilomyces variotii]